MKTGTVVSISAVVALAVVGIVLMDYNPASRTRAQMTGVSWVMFPYVTATSAFNTGLSIGNTTGEVSNTPPQAGRITFYFYDRSQGYVGRSTSNKVEPGHSFVDLASAILPQDVTSFSGYVVARVEFQELTAYAFVADSAFDGIAHSPTPYRIPPPSIKY